MPLYDEETSPIGTYAFGNIVGAPEPDIGDQLAWQAGLKVENDKIQPLLTAIDYAINEYRKEHPTFPSDPEKIKLPFGPARDTNPDDPEGEKIESKTETIFKFKRKLEYKNKQKKTLQRSAPTIYDAGGTVCNDKIDRIGWGSVGRIYYKVLPYIFRGNHGVSLALEGFQIKSLRSNSVSGPVAPIEGGGWEAPASIDMAETSGDFEDPFFEEIG